LTKSEEEIAGHWQKSFFCVFMDRYRVKVHKHAKKERGKHPAIFTEQAWLIKDLLHGERTPFSCGAQQVISSTQNSVILPTGVANHNAGFNSACALTELAL